jgi:hypothetical protein
MIGNLSIYILMKIIYIMYCSVIYLADNLYVVELFILFPQFCDSDESYLILSCQCIHPYVTLYFDLVAPRRWKWIDMGREDVLVPLYNGFVTM